MDIVGIESDRSVRGPLYDPHAGRFAQMSGARPNAAANSPPLTLDAAAAHSKVFLTAHGGCSCRDAALDAGEIALDPFDSQTTAFQNRRYRTGLARPDLGDEDAERPQQCGEMRSYAAIRG